MQRNISDKVFLRQNVFAFDNAGESDATDRTASHYNDAKEIRELKYILGVLEMKFQGMLEDIDTREKVAPPSYKDMKEFDFQILLTHNYYVNSSNSAFVFL